MDGLAAANPSWISTTIAGKTFENRDIKVLTLKKASTKRAIWIDCGIHAREWIAISTCVYMIDAVWISKLKLSRSFNFKKYKFVRESQSAAKNILDYYEIKLLPVVNPDGYEYSRRSQSVISNDNR